MADKSLPERDLRPVVEAAEAKSEVDTDRRQMLRRVAIGSLAGLPVVLASVCGRNAWAGGGTASCPASAKGSACFGH